MMVIRSLEPASVPSDTMTWHFYRLKRRPMYQPHSVPPLYVMLGPFKKSFGRIVRLYHGKYTSDQARRLVRSVTMLSVSGPLVA